MTKDHPDRMSDLAFQLMSASFAVLDFFFPRVERRVARFEITQGMTVVDYGCGPGRYTIRFAKLVGDGGKVYAVDIQELALEKVRRRAQSEGLDNIVPVLADGYRTEIPKDAADMVFALDMFFGVADPSALLIELHRIVKPDGILVISDEHQSRKKALAKIERSGKWQVVEQNDDHIRCAPIGENDG